MENRVLNEQDLNAFCVWLTEEEKSTATVEKYLRDTRAFFVFAKGRTVTKELVREWKESLLEKEYAAASINSMLASLNSLLHFRDWEDCKVKNLKVQQRTYTPENKELTKAEYSRLLDAAESQPKLRLIMETICGTGIRVSELQYFTMETVGEGEIRISNKGKIRTILIPGKLKKKLLDWAKKNGIRTGMIFCTKNGKPVNRSNIWAKMKKLCREAGVEADKVFPHNLRKLFARIFYSVQKDIAKLADVLGHSNINTTRIYIMTTGREHRKTLDSLGLVV